MNHTFPVVRSPLVLGAYTLPNRIVMPPLVIWQSGEDGLVTDAHIQHYRESAGPGLVIVEAACVSSNGRLAATQIGIFTDEQTPGLARLADTIMQSGAVAGIQIHHAGAQSTVKKNWGASPVVVSLCDSSPEGAVELDESAIKAVIEDFAAAAERAAAAGFQVIEIHGAHGYLGSQFLSPRHNLRTDAWGGSLENRARFLIEVVQAVRDRLHGRSSRPLVACRLGVVDQQLQLQEGIETARMLIDAGVEVLNISNAGGMPKAQDGSRLPNTEDGLTALFHLACQVRAALTEAPYSNVPVIGVGGIKTPADAELALTRHQPVDLVAVGRGMLADPGWAAKSLAGREASISSCVDCKPKCFHFSEPERCPARRALFAGK